MPRYDGPIVDLDVHHVWKSEAEVVNFLPSRWQEYLSANASRPLLPSFTLTNAVVAAHRARLADAMEPGGSKGTDYDILRRKMLDPFRYYRALLTHDVGHYGGHLNPYFGAAICRAANDWNIETWLAKDERFYSVVVVPTNAPAAAAEEIRRVGDHPRIVAVCLAGNLLGRPFGDPVYDPIYDAATEMGLQIVIHYGNSDRPDAATTMVGRPQAAMFGISQFSQQAMHFITSYIVHGVFEKFPNLRVLIQEYGVAWLPYVMWRLDQNYRLLRHESPWVKRLPSEYIREHVRLTTQPLEESPVKGRLAQLLSAVDGIENLLCFSTDWPHWSADDPNYIARHLPDEWHEKVFYANACEFFGWDLPTEHVSSAVAARDLATGS
jgi:uncharacterized protein